MNAMINFQLYPVMNRSGNAALLPDLRLNFAG
jgi:hypothetical protein